MPLLEGTDGVQKMSKSLGNYIGINEPPVEIFGKVMSISDELMWRYYELLTNLSVAEITSLRSAAGSGARNPRDLKVELAKRIVTDFHSREAADAAEEDFVRRFRNKETPDEVEERTLPSNQPKGWDLAQLLVTLGMAESKAEARRLIQQGGVSVGGEKQAIANSLTISQPGMSLLIKVGKRRFVRVNFI
jgi:tyrosyl-tRNA synthetase